MEERGKNKVKGMESGFPGKGTAHNHSVSRKARRRSLGSKRLRLLPGIVILSIALFFIARSASTYMWVVAVLSCPSQSAITVISTVMRRNRCPRRSHDKSPAGFSDSRRRGALKLSEMMRGGIGYSPV